MGQNEDLFGVLQEEGGKRGNREWKYSLGGGSLE